MKMIRISFVIILINLVFVNSLTKTKQNIIEAKGEEDLVENEINKSINEKNITKMEKSTNLKKNSDWKIFFTKGENYERLLFHFLIFFQLMNIILFIWLFFQCLSNKENISIISKI